MCLRQLLPKIKNNNLITLKLYTEDIAEDDDLEEAGRAITANTSIKYLLLDYFLHRAGAVKYDHLFRGISQNKSIECVQVSYSDVCEKFLLVLGKSISRLYFVSCNIKVDIFAWVLQTTNLLSEIIFFPNCTFELDEGIRPYKRAKLQPVHGDIHLNTLEFNETCLGKHGCEAVSRFLLSPNVTLKNSPSLTAKIKNGIVHL